MLFINFVFTIYGSADDSLSQELEFYNIYKNFSLVIRQVDTKP